MARLDYRQKTHLKIWLVAILLVLTICILSACNNNSGTYDLSNVDNASEIQSQSSSSLTGFIRNSLIKLNDKIGNFGWTVVCFTIILRLILSPLDIWQKIVGRKNAKAMKRMKPELEALNEKFKDDKQRLQQETQALYKREKYSMLGSCLPMILTLVVFFLVFAGFRDMVGYQYAKDYQTSRDTYYSQYNETNIAGLDQAITDGFEITYVVKEDGSAVVTIDSSVSEERKAQIIEKLAQIDGVAVDKAQTAVAEQYNSKEARSKRGWIYIKSADKYLINNIFVQDGWKTSVPDYTAITGQSGFATARVVGFTADEYNLIMAKVIGTGGWGKNGKWNGLLILPILSILVSFLSQKLTQLAQGTPPPTQGQSQGSMKIMQYMMPIMMGVFALLYSGAFTIYMFVSSLMAIFFQLTFNLVAYIIDYSKGEAEPINFKRKSK